ncbi:MAG: oligopeptide transporter, OPT family, partial [bacterium LCO1.1]|nr:oligopeptide transporter, OPT family [Candidatus Weimeria bifida]
MGLIRFILHRDSILENNMVQTIGSAGESVQQALFLHCQLCLCGQTMERRLPFIWTYRSYLLVGGVLGVLFMVPLRNALIVQEHGTLRI